MNGLRWCTVAVVLSSPALPGTVVAQRVDTRPRPDSAEVLAVALGIVAADNQRDLAAVLRHYAPDAVLLPPNAPPVVGVDAIRPRYRELFGSYDPAIETVIEELVVRGDLAYVRGRNRGRLLGRGGTKDRALSDAYVMILRRGRQGSWRISRLMWHPTEPPVTGPRP